MKQKQRTLREPAVIRGIGVFTGQEITVEIRPAPPNHGPSFELISGGNVHPIPVSVRNIIETENRTVLADSQNRDIQINIVEHVLGTLHGMGIDNSVIRVNSIELPLIDGSALEYLLAVENAGTVEQDADRAEIVIEKPIFIDDNAVILVVPYDGLKISYYLDHPNDIAGKRIADMEVTPETFRKRIGPARTFVKAEKVNDLLASGAVKNTDENQILIVYPDKTNQPLRFADEFCYHKMLDILGDFYLSGRRLRGHVIGIRSGHYQNRKMIRKIVEEYL